METLNNMKVFSEEIKSTLKVGDRVRFGGRPDSRHTGVVGLIGSDNYPEGVYIFNNTRNGGHEYLENVYRPLGHKYAYVLHTQEQDTGTLYYIELLENGETYEIY